ncbi:ABC transporter ATP-binding protein [Kitasatospora sp. GAS204B]|uniref:ABC transporter ATP-binding protein n=1 Tax=unclassified Kitasatospora TaxID=2633591 RepID=UPI002476DE10|nr:ABC transporter ATP-binding protein [Kitasatospora sp. GAS204B]MDH6116547.1 peptide/nickel transport system ATP-binding protein [Kitasatospora sp. GAS204B]
MSTLTKSESIPAPEAGHAFLSVRDLQVRFRTEDGIVKAVNNLSFDLEQGKTLGIVGESGSGKSVSNLAVMGLHNPKNTTIEGSITLDGQDLLKASQKDLEKLRGNKMSMIFQDALAALSPYYTIGRQIAEPFMKHTGASKKEGRDRAIEMLRRVGIPQPQTRVDDFPHQFSGGMRQRAMIAMALVCDPQMLIADEPTTALDVTVQAQIIDLLKDLQQESGTSIIFITHDLGVIREIADDVLVMYAGRAVERGTMREVLKSSQHPYGWGLLSSIPRINASVDVPLMPIPGTPPSLLNPPSGCAFHPRCTYRELVVGDKCVTERPPLELANGHLSACHLTPAQKQSILTEQILPRLSS